MKAFCFALLLLVGLGTALVRAAAPPTDGQATFQVTTKTANGNYAPRHVMAIWVTDSQGNFVKTLKRQAAARQQHLYKFWANAKNYTPVDGTTGATLTSHRSHAVTWDCRNTNDVVVPDGLYHFNVEFTEANAQGPWTGSTVLAFRKATDPLTNAFNDLPNFTNMRVVYVPYLHDVAIVGLFPTHAPPGGIVPVVVTVTNRLSSPETFALTLSNLTSNALIGSQEVSLAGSTGVSVTFDWNTAVLSPGNYQLAATASTIPGEVYTQDNQLVQALTLRAPIHDLALTRFMAPSMVYPGSSTNLSLTLTNRGDFEEAAELVVTDHADSTTLASTNVSIPPDQSTDLLISWNTAGASLGRHLLTARVAPVPGETITNDNALAADAVVAQGLTTNILFARGATWRYNDTGTDLTDTPWKLADYYDGFWAAGRAPLGYNNSGIVTRLGFGPSVDDKFITYYFRTRFMVDVLPLSLKCRVLRDDGVVVYLNGIELMRDNMPEGPVVYGTTAPVAVGGSDETRYFEFPLSAASIQGLFLGENLLSAEVHQSGPASSDLSFDLELEAVQPAIPVVHDLAVLEVMPGEPVRQGDPLHIAVTVTNRGNVSELFRVDLVETNSGQTVGTRQVGPLAPGTAVPMGFDWTTHASEPGPRSIKAVTVQGNVTNLANSAQGSATIQPALTAPETVNIQGALGGRCAAVAANNLLVLVGAGPTLEIMDRSSGGLPSQVGRLRLPGVIEAVAISGTSAFVACGPKGLQVVDIATPSYPRHIATVPFPGHAYDVKVAGTLACVAAGGAGLRVLDVSNPSTPAPVGTYLTEGPARAVTLENQRAVVLDAYAGLLVLDLSAPSSPVLLGKQQDLQAGVALAQAGQTAYALDAQGFLWMISLANQQAPQVTVRMPLPTPGLDIVATSSHLYVADDSSGVLTADLLAPGAPRWTATNTLSGQALGIVAVDASLYVAAGLAGLESWNLTSPSTPSPEGLVPIGLRAVYPAIAGSVAYVAAGELGLRIYSVADIARPSLLASVGGLVNARAVAVQGPLACVADGPGGVRTVDVSDPSAPRLSGTYTAPSLGWVRAVASSGQQVAATDGARLVLLDVSDSLRPVLMDEVGLTGYGFALAMQSQWLFVAAGPAGVQIYNIAGGRLELATTCTTPGPATDVAVSGVTASVACGPAGWLLLDITDPRNPRLLQSIPAEGLASSVAFGGGTLFLANSENAVLAAETPAPLNPLAAKSFGPMVRALKLAANDQVALVAEDSAGMAVLAPILTEPYVFVMFRITPDGDHTVTVQWRSEPGRTYTVHRSSNLRAGFTPVATGMAATPPLNTFRDTLGAGFAFYMVSIE